MIAVRIGALHSPLGLKWTLVDEEAVSVPRQKRFGLERASGLREVLDRERLGVRHCLLFVVFPAHARIRSRS
jgi:hypothetical protein